MASGVSMASASAGSSRFCELGGPAGSIFVIAFSRCSTRFLALKFAQVGGRLLRAFVDVRSDGALAQRFAQLRAKKTAGRVARHPGIEAVHEVTHQRRIVVDNA